MLTTIKNIASWQLLFFLLSSIACQSEFPRYKDLIVEELPQKGTLEIPKIIHQVWHVWSPSGTVPPPDWQSYTQRLKELHPDWEYRLWDTATSEQYIRDYHPWFLETYLGYKQPVKRADAIRYFILNDFGGVYVDFGFYAVKNIESMLLGASLVVGEENLRQNLIGNAFIASVPKHPFWKEAHQNLPKTQNLGVIEATGPGFLTTQINHYVSASGDPSIRVLDRKFIYPYASYEVRIESALTCRNKSTTCATLFPDAFLVKHWQGSWWGQ